MYVYWHSYTGWGLTDVVSEEEEVVIWSPALEDVKEVEVLPVHVSDHHHLTNTTTTATRHGQARG